MIARYRTAVALLSILPAALLAEGTSTAAPIKPRTEPLVLEQQGSFFANGKMITTNYAGTSGTPGRIVVNQMYVEYWATRSLRSWTRLGPPF